MLRIFHNSIGDRTHLLAGWCLVVPYALGTLIAVNLVDMFTHRNRLIRAFGFTHITIDAFFSD